MAEAGRMWRCPHCGRSFANCNQTHTCAVLGELDAHFTGCDPAVREIFDRILAAVDRLGPVAVLAEKTRIALHARMSFAAFTARRHWLNGHVVLAERLDSPRFTRVETYSPRNILHAFRLDRADQVDAEVRDWLARAYRVGQQQHLDR
ncbi:MAG: DUF5655 domain-containing protein [Actinomycetes bacterium]